MATLSREHWVTLLALFRSLRAGNRAVLPLLADAWQEAGLSQVDANRVTDRALRLMHRQPWGTRPAPYRVRPTLTALVAVLQEVSRREWVAL